MLWGISQKCEYIIIYWLFRFKLFRLSLNKYLVRHGPLAAGMPDY